MSTELTRSGDLNVVAVVKGSERYIWLYDDKHAVDVLRCCGRFASDPDLSFSWYDAAIVSQKVRNVAEGREGDINVRIAE